MNKSELRVGDRIRVIGDSMDCTEHLDDQILTIVDLNDDMPGTITAREDEVLNGTFGQLILWR